MRVFMIRMSALINMVVVLVVAVRMVMMMMSSTTVFSLVFYGSNSV